MARVSKETEALKLIDQPREPEKKKKKKYIEVIINYTGQWRSMIRAGLRTKSGYVVL